MKSDGVLVQTVCRALEWLPNIACITYSSHPHHLPAEQRETQDLVPRGMSTSPGTNYTRSDHPFRQLVAALHMSQLTGIRELKTESLGADPGTEFALGIFDLNDSELVAAKYLFRGLEKISLSMALWVPSERKFGAIIQIFASLLRSSLDLKDLYFRPTHWKSQIGVRPLFARLGLKATWPKLRSLNSQQILADEQDVLSITKRHKETLVSVKYSENGYQEFCIRLSKVTDQSRMELLRSSQAANLGMQVLSTVIPST